MLINTPRTGSGLCGNTTAHFTPFYASNGTESPRTSEAPARSHRTPKHFSSLRPNPAMESQQGSLWAVLISTYAAATVCIVCRFLGRYLARTPLWYDDYAAIACYVGGCRSSPQSQRGWR